MKKGRGRPFKVGKRVDMEHKIDTTSGTSPMEGIPQSRLRGWLGDRGGWFIAGIIVLISSGSYIVLQIARTPWPPWPPSSIAGSYIALFLVPVGLVFTIWSRYSLRVEERRTVEISEVENLYSEITQYSHSLENDPVRTVVSELAEAEKKKLDGIDRPILELDVLPLRKCLVDLYSPLEELGAKASHELANLDEYRSNYAEPQRELVSRVKDHLSKLKESKPSREQNKGNCDDKNATEGDEESPEALARKLRAELKSLRGTVAEYDRAYALGESLRICVTLFLFMTVMVTLLIGILPLVHIQGNGNITILHWAALGTAGALLSALIALYSLDLPELGETQGNPLLAGIFTKVAAGVVAAVLLYSALWGGDSRGKGFPHSANCIG